MLVTLACGMGHVAVSVALGLIGVVLLMSLSTLEHIESLRGSIAAWGLVAVGFVYAVWGLRRAWRNRPHSHVHVHADGTAHRHPHIHEESHLHVHEAPGTFKATPWVLFILFALGPCEALIPLLMYPAAKGSLAGLGLIVGVFGVVTVATMVAAVVIGSWGISLFSFKPLERYGHALAGGAVCVSGLAIQVLGL